ncbi:uncharacterized protein AMSG_05598 [Thecamonas trahens ATCC 50062]|uniref:Par3/HAL N-terminal domain-containing protein n=1 Tax=Thecamonas trahens ATCC 50062 TaxID=461836 RepID=A0A0L0DB73_THETB|nr:hypothetical protein AMSG_05598 [Thecamonas trahens ATCC 50062]KNC49562.1 hypothetical protein AMSG_05598 [Thecamonas trahens ATCC 50062]|eukprot:XP_013757671.1 hypothetical protein AMSG_05598 [Thecamonas trahens ATCC 50062]
MRINVHVREKTIAVQCGDGIQAVIWLARVGVCRFDASYGEELGQPVGVRLEDGVRLDPAAIVAETLEDDGHVWVVLADDVQPSGAPSPATGP